MKCEKCFYEPYCYLPEISYVFKKELESCRHFKDTSEIVKPVNTVWTYPEQLDITIAICQVIPLLRSISYNDNISLSERQQMEQSADTLSKLLKIDQVTDINTDE